MAMIEINWHPSKRDLRLFGGLFVVFAAAIGLYLYGQHDTPIVSGLLWGLGGMVGLLTLISPASIRPVYVVLMLVTFPIGFVVSTVVLSGIYYLILTPTGLLMRWAGYDPMQRHFEAQTGSYWVKRTPVPEVRRYFRQY